MEETARWRRLWATYGQTVEPFLLLAGVYWVQFLITRGSVATVPQLAVVRPIKAVPAYLFTGWDGIHYLRLAQSFNSYAWPPLYPLTLRAVSGVFGSGLEAAAVLVNLVSHAAIVLLAYAFVRSNPRLDDVPGWLFAALLLFFPGHNVFFAAYSESAFLALLLGTCVAYQRERLWLAGLLCGAAILTRNMGVYFGAAMVLVEVGRMVRQRRFVGWRLAAVALWVPFFVGWNAWLAGAASTNPLDATRGWQEELLAKHVPAGTTPKLWVLRYLALSAHKEVLYFWGVARIGRLLLAESPYR